MASKLPMVHDALFQQFKRLQVLLILTHALASEGQNPAKNVFTVITTSHWLELYSISESS